MRVVEPGGSDSKENSRIPMVQSWSHHGTTVKAATNSRVPTLETMILVSMKKWSGQAVTRTPIAAGYNGRTRVSRFRHRTKRENKSGTNLYRSMPLLIELFIYRLSGQGSQSSTQTVAAHSKSSEKGLLPVKRWQGNVGWR